MSEDFLKNPLSLFDIRGKTAIVTGATGAFGALAAKVLAGAGANVVLCANNAGELKKVAAACEQLGGKVAAVAKRPSSEANCDAIVDAAVKTFGRVDILVVASGQNKVSKIVDQKPEDFLGCEWGDSGITVNALGPTVFRSPLTQWMFEDSDRSRDVRKGFLTRVPKGRLGEPSDLAGPLLFLASKASDFYTGHILYADGGYTAG